MTWPEAVVLLGAMLGTAFLVGYLVHLFVYYRLEYEPPERPSDVDTRGWAEYDEDK